MELYNEIIDYWFGDLSPSTPENGRFELWFGKADETDREIERRFGPQIDRAAAGAFDDWLESPESAIALIVLLDQFPRNINRDSPKAFAYDAKAREIARRGIESGHDRDLPFYARIFFYLPFEHSERIEDQEKSLELFGRIQEQAPAALKDNAGMVNKYAVRHHEIIKRFGRFPHRNQALGRLSTEEEIEFLKEPDSSF